MIRRGMDAPDQHQGIWLDAEGNFIKRK